MPYRRGYRRYRSGKRIKYSVQQRAFGWTAAGASSSAQIIVPATTLEGMRKVKHLMVNLTAGQAAGGMYWALVYVPQGTVAQNINITTGETVTSMYEPNQFVMNCGIIDVDAGPIRFSSPIARNLNDGDSIWLVLRPVSSEAVPVFGTCRYAISLH